MARGREVGVAEVGEARGELGAGEGSGRPQLSWPKPKKVEITESWVEEMRLMRLSGQRAER